ncbi:hypothetical protein PoB_005383000 [Plakobranchus ocellatus]|uniref:Uncharacterized protein n=1 Tax=Plakobranchus ocellatus TaxID=259542 RepID=A0AAV4C3T0_9GAST|nr:hypothetical protein PoB_005383000 [Plakobranchus ocellatus]
MSCSLLSAPVLRHLAWRRKGSEVMFGTIFVLLNLLLRMATAQRASVNIVTNFSSFLCTDDFLVVGEDFVTFELDLSGNNSDYTYNEFDWPTFRAQTFVTVNGITQTKNDFPICDPFTTPQHGFCVKRNIINTTGCSCEAVGTHVYRVKAVYRIHDVNETRGRAELLWPSIYKGDISKYYYFPEVRAKNVAEQQQPVHPPQTVRGLPNREGLWLFVSKRPSEKVLIHFLVVYAEGAGPP